jgi:hypothetical protein
MVRFCIDISKYDSRFHTIVSGPYENLNACYAPCGASDPAITTTSTTTTQPPASVSPPLANGNSIFNPNDEAAFIDVQYSNDGGITWIPFTTLYVNANTGTIIGGLSSTTTTRARISLNGAVTGWSNSATYSNIDNIVAVTNGNVVTNSNAYKVYAITQYLFYDTWIPYTSVIIEENKSATLWGLSSTTTTRARFAKIGPGVSVSAWSST